MSDTIHKKHEDNKDKEITKERRSVGESENKGDRVSESNTLYPHS